MYSVQVLISTYNGSNYLSEQLDSILKQQDVAVDILIRDDGSTDNTPDILHDYASVYPNVKYILGKNCGVVASFFRLFELADKDHDFYALSDQDDVWDLDKLKIACETIAPETTNNSKKKKKNKQTQIPQMYCCDSIVVDENLIPLDANLKSKVVSDTLPVASQLCDNPKPTVANAEVITPAFENALIENIARGASMVFNQAVLEKIKIAMPKDVYMHDWWVYLVASCYGNVIYDVTPHYLYRQHSSNALGASQKDSSKTKRRLKQSRENGGHVLKQAKSFARIYKVPDNKIEALNVILHYQDSFKNRCKGFSGKYVFRQSKKDNLIFRLLFFTNHL